MKILDVLTKIKQLFHPDKQKPVENKTVRGIQICSVILIFGTLGMLLLSSMKEEPAETVNEQPVLQVEVIKAEKDNYPVYLSAFGEAESVRIVPIASEISGKITEVHPRLENGEIINKGELLFKVDPRNYELVIKTGRERLKILRKSRKIAATEFQRVKNLYEINGIGTVSGVESAEKAWLTAADMENSIKQIVETAELNLEKCEVRAEFTGRLNRVFLEKGQYVVPGKSLLTLIDDQILEIRVSFDFNEVRQWLDLKKTSGWYSEINRNPCEIRWTGDNRAGFMHGILHRVVEYDRKTRMITLAVRTGGNDTKDFAAKKDGIVDGMFCSVKIPGKIITNVVRLPRNLLSMDNTVYTSQKNRLKTVYVNVLKADDEYVYINDGLDGNELVVATRLVNPLENSPIKIVNPI